MSKKTKTNRYKPEGREIKNFKPGSEAGIDFCLKCITIVAFMSILSLASIFVYDFITQSNFFKIKKIEISGIKRIQEQELLRFADLSRNKNIFEINLFSTEKLLESHPWIQSASVKRNPGSVLSISVIEQELLAIVKIENLADILINTRGLAFKEYNPLQDNIKNLPFITGLELAGTNNQYSFDSTLFNSIMDFLQTDKSVKVRQIFGDKNTGITIEANDIYNPPASREQNTIFIKLGFNNFKAKLNKARHISDYIDKNFPEKIICAMDLFNIEKVFIKTKLNNALHSDLEKGV